MSKRFLTIPLAAALVLTGLVGPPARGAAAVPEVVQITDPAGDANYLNDQGQAGNGVGVGGARVSVPDTDDNRTCGQGTPAGVPCDVGNASDILAVWFENDAEKISANVHTELPPPANQGLAFRVYTNPGEGSVGSNASGCLWFEAYIKGTNPNTGQDTTFRAESFARLRDVCDLGSAASVAIPGELTIATLEDGTGVTSITIPRASTTKFDKGTSIVAPYAEIRNLSGGQFPSPVGLQTATAPTIDTTKPGIDYALVDGGVDPPPPPPPPPPCKKKDRQTCNCPAFVPAPEGEGAELTKITEKHTAKKPAIVMVEADAGVGVGGTPTEQTMSHAFENLQVDLKKKKSTGLYVRLEFPDYADYDLYMRNPDGTVAAQAAGFNPAPGHVDPDPMGGHTETGSENIDGIKTAECGGYTAEIATATGIGGTLTMKVWLGKVQYTPPAPQEGGSTNATRVRADRGWVKADRYF